MSRTETSRPEASRAGPQTPNRSLIEEEFQYYEFAELSRKVAKRPLVLFFGRATFSDNTKYLFLAASKAAAAIGCDVIWCSFEKTLLSQLQAKGIRCFDLKADGQKTLSLLLEASVAVFCENLAAALGWSPMLNGCLAGAQKIQLWHGVSVKHLDLMTIPHFGLADPMFRRQLRFASNVDHFLSTASALDSFWVRAFGCTSLVRAGQPRNEVIVRPPTPEEMIGAELPPDQEALLRADGKRKFLLVPTWQRGKVPAYISTAPFHARIAKWAAANNAVVFVKPHPFLLRFEVPKDIPGLVHFLGGGVDVYPWMSRFDALITDYSSIMFDFLLLHRPIFTFQSPAQIALSFEPDYSLIPEGAFRYDFNTDDFESVLEKNLAAHPLQADQRKLSAQLFETSPQDACAQLLPFLGQCSTTAVDKGFTITMPAKPAELLRPAV